MVSILSYAWNFALDQMRYHAIERISDIYMDILFCLNFYRLIVRLIAKPLLKKSHVFR